MKLNKITNLDAIQLIENATELFKIKKYHSKEFVEAFIGLVLARSSFYGTINNENVTNLKSNRTTFDSDSDINILIEGIVVLDQVPINVGAGNIVYTGYGILEVNGVVIYNGSTTIVSWGDIIGTVTDQTDLVTYINSVTDPIDTRVTQLESKIYEVTYREIIDISATTTGTVSFPTGASLDQTEFPGNAVLSTRTGTQIDYQTPTDGAATVTVNLDGAGNWTASQTYSGDVYLIFRLRIAAPDYSNLDNDKVIEFYVYEIRGDEHVAATTLNTWVLDADDIYYADFLHGLSTDDIGIEIYDTVTKETVIPHKLDRTTTNNLRVYVQGNTSSLRIVVWDAIWGVQEVSGSSTVINPTSPYAANNNDVILMDATSGGQTVNLPAVASSTNFKIDIKKTDASGNTITIDPNGAELIEGGATAIITTQYEALSLICDGVQWWILASS